MKLPVGEMCVLRQDAILWRRYPGATPEDGVSYQSFATGDTFTIIGEAENRGQYFTYVMDFEGNTFVSPTQYLTFRVNLVR